MEWLVVGIIIVVLLGIGWLTNRSNVTKGMTAKDIGEIADKMWKEWKGE